MRNHNQTHAIVGDAFHDLVKDLRLNDGIQSRRGLVSQKNTWSARKRHRDQSPLGHPSTVLVRVTAGLSISIGYAHACQKLNGMRMRNLP